MRLAIKNGRIGRVQKTFNGDPTIAEATPADQRGELYVSTSTIAADQQRLMDAAKAKADMKAARKLKLSQMQAEQIEIFKTMHNVALKEKANKPLNPNDIRIREYLTQQMGRSETENVARSMKADFYDREEIVETDPTRPIVERADFRMNSLVGNPLSRDGSYGYVSDYEKIVNGTELDNDRVTNVVGGTMLRHPQQMGFDISSLWDKATDQLQTSLENRIETDVNNMINPPASVPLAQTVVARPASPVASVTSMFSTIPKEVLYGAAVMAGVGILLLVMKKVRS